MAANRGEPLQGDRSAHDMSDANLHASDIEDAALTRHLPAPASAGNYARDDGSNWDVQSGLPLEDLNEYTRGEIIRGGAADWEDYDASTLGAVLIGDGTDIISTINPDIAGTLSVTGATLLRNDATVEGSEDEVQLTVKADAAQTANIVEVQTSGGVDLVVVDANGDLIVQPTANSTDTLNINQSDGTNVVQVDTTSKKLTVTSGTTGQSTIEAGLIVNNGSGNGAIDDFQVNSDTKTAVLVDASAETLDVGVPATFADSVISNAGRRVQTTRQTTTYTALVSDDAIFCNTDGGAWTLTLPAGVDGQRFHITNCGSSGNDLTVDGDGAEEIDGETTQVLSDGESIIIIFETTEEWRIF